MAFTAAMLASWPAVSRGGVSPTPASFTVLHHFNALEEGWQPLSTEAPTLVDGVLYGGTFIGSQPDANEGVLFSVHVDGTAYTVIHGFTPMTDGYNLDGRIPQTTLVHANAKLYGTATGGGAFGNGTLYSLNLDGSQFTTLSSFTGVLPLTGYGLHSPIGTMALSGTTLYGVTAYGGSPDANVQSTLGRIYSASTNGGTPTTLHNFLFSWDGDHMYAPYGPGDGLVLADGVLYGTTTSGGYDNHGVIFAMNVDGTGFVTLHNFLGTDGAMPIAAMTLAGGKLYGSTSSGGANNQGVLFSINLNGTGFTVLHDFAVNAGNVQSALVVNGTTVYGTTPSGGTLFNGSIFSVQTNGSGFTVLFSMDRFVTGRVPGGLVLSGNSLYGMASGGGSFDHGTVFRYDLATVDPPQISVADLSVAEGNAGTSVATFTVTLSTPPLAPVSYDIATAHGTASNDDFVDKTLVGEVFGIGQTSRDFTVTINGDTAVEGNETFTVNLGNVAGAVVADAQALGRIVNDDSAGLSIADVTVAEGDSGSTSARFVVSLDNPMPGPVSFDVATSNGSAQAGSDYTSVGKSRFLDAGRTRVVVEVMVNGDTSVEPDENFTVTLSNVVGAAVIDATATGTISNDDVAPARARARIAEIRGARERGYRPLPNLARPPTRISNTRRLGVMEPDEADFTVARLDLPEFSGSRSARDEARVEASYAVRLARASHAICQYLRSPDVVVVTGMSRVALADLALALNDHDGALLFDEDCGPVAYRAASAADGLGFLINEYKSRTGASRARAESITLLNGIADRTPRGGSRAGSADSLPQLLRVRFDSGLHSDTLNVLACPASAAGSWQSLAEQSRLRQRADPDERLLLMATLGGAAPAPARAGTTETTSFPIATAALARAYPQSSWQVAHFSAGFGVDRMGDPSQPSPIGASEPVLVTLRLR